MSTSIDGNAVTNIADLARGAAEIQTVELEDKRLLAGNGHGLKVIYDPQETSWPEALRVHSLSGVTEYIGNNPDGLEFDHCILQVVSPALVRLYSPVQGPARARERVLYLQADALTFNEGLTGRYLPVEEMMIALQTRVQDSPARKKVLKLLGNVDDKEIRTQQDDGVSQKITVKAGPEIVELEDVPNPVVLAPYRTFPEIAQQPESPFVLRVRSGRGVEAALFEGDGGAWQQSAIDMVKAYLAEDAGPDWPKIIG